MAHRKARRGAAQRIHLLALVSLTTALGACQSEPSVARREFTIAQGSAAPHEKSVFFIEITQDQGTAICSASLISPKHLLTAAHCVTGQFGDIDCAGDLLDEVLPAQQFRVSMVADLQSAPTDEETFLPVEKAAVVFRGANLCGNDLAIVTLAQEIPIDKATPYQVGPVVQKGDNYRAYGYGAVHASGTGEGIRRASAEEKVVCVGQMECDGASLQGAAGAGSITVPPVESAEFVGSTNACPGDSGGPAVSEETGELVGVLSRGYDDCSLNIFSQVQSAAFREFIRTEFANSGATIPSWALEIDEPTPDPPDQGEPSPGLGGSGGVPNPERPIEVAPPTKDQGGCQWNSTSRSPGLPLAFLLAAVSLLFFRMRRSP